MFATVSDWSVGSLGIHPGRHCQVFIYSGKAFSFGYRGCCQALSSFLDSITIEMSIVSPRKGKRRQGKLFYLLIFVCISVLAVCWVFVATCRLSLAATVGITLWLWCTGFLLQWLVLLQNTGSWVWVLQQLWLTSLVAPCHVESSWPGDRTYVPCIGRWLLIHYTTREVLRKAFY